jgi:hypothetical protein
MFTINLALVSEVEGHDQSDVSRVAAALQRQATRDFEPIWKERATIDAFPTLEDVPVGYWPLIVETDIHADAAGFHEDQDGQPFSLIAMSDSWSLTASHEMLEMLADPFGKRFVPGKSPKPDQGRVEFLVEVCDPSEDAQFGYTVNDILVSDFYTPHFFDPKPGERVQYSFTDAIKEPRQVLPGGYLSWHDPVSGQWWQETFFGESPKFRPLGPFEGKGSVRAWIDSKTEHPGIDEGLEQSDSTLTAAVARGEETASSAAKKAEAWRKQIRELKGRKG